MKLASLAGALVAGALALWQGHGAIGAAGPAALEIARLADVARLNADRFAASEAARAALLPAPGACR